MQPYNLSEIPFSLPGSFLTISSLSTATGCRLAYRTSSSRAVNRRDMPFNANDFFEIALTRDGKEIPYGWSAAPHRLDLIASGDGFATFVFANPDTLLFKTNGLGLRLLPAKTFISSWQTDSSSLSILDYPARGIHQLRASQGTSLSYKPARSVYNLEGSAQERPIQVDFASGSGGIEGAIRFSHTENLWTEPLPFLEDCLTQRVQEYEMWRQRMPETPAIYQSTAEQAWFLLWNCQTPQTGALTRPAIYMSKFWMNNIWSWDNCFNALAVARADPKLAWEQLLLFFDHQDAHGIVPDCINDLEAVYGFTKPPIYGWAIRKLVQTLGVKASLPYLEQIYKPLSRLTEWWYEVRDFDRDGLPQYHHGNDSGWDNATVFDQGYPTEGADLAAHLVLQCETLAFISKTLDKNKAAARWQERADQQLARLLTHSLKKDRFISPLNGKTDASRTKSLLNRIPILLGRRLPEKTLATLIADLSPGGPFLTEWGLATESPKSPHYQADGYWRGPIWAPSTYLIVDGLEEAGQIGLARTIAERFCDLCVEHPGFWENYDALTGQGLRCPGYSWTASVFLLLAEWLAKHPLQE
jgi:putative isomerase